MRILPVLALLTLLISSCSTQVDYIANTSGRAARPDDCDISVFLPNTQVGKSYDIIGSILIGDSGLTMDCGQATVIKQAKAKGCQVGADAIVLTEIKEPDWISTCYRIKGNMIVYNSVSGPAAVAVPSAGSGQPGNPAPSLSHQTISPVPPNTRKQPQAEAKEFEPIPFE